MPLTSVVIPAPTLQDAGWILLLARLGTAAELNDPPGNGGDIEAVAGTGDSGHSSLWTHQASRITNLLSNLLSICFAKTRHLVGK